MAVAIRALVFNNTVPAVSIDPPSGSWGAGSSLPVDYYGGIENTELGQKLFDADYQLKNYIIGYHADGSVVTSSVPGYESQLDRWLANNPGTTPGPGTRWWITPQTLTLKMDTATNSFVFDQSTMQVLTQPLGSNDPGWDTAASQFAQWATSAYL